MLFSSLIFLWLFLPVVVVAYYLFPRRFRNILLLFASLIFYAWGEPRYVLIMLFSIVLNWLIGLMIDRYPARKKLLLIASIVCNLSLIGYYKYFNFLIGVSNQLLATSFKMQEISLPIGISFFTFQIMSYVIDLYRGDCKVQRNLLNLALYISFFPQLIAGPIVRYGDIDKQLSDRVCSTTKIALGLRRFTYGLAKKVLIANTMAQVVDSIFGLEYADLTGAFAWIAIMFYSLQIYFDFSGYSDMAIGLGKIFGFEFSENFDHPYESRSIGEFWRRWHISLGTWFREYVYIPLGGNRKGAVRTYINLFIVFFLTGLWHGASFAFILWGLYQGFFQIIERLGFNKFLKRHPLIGRIYMLTVLTFGWVIFRSGGLRLSYEVFRRMIFPWRYTKTSFIIQTLIGRKQIFYAIIGAIGSFWGLIYQKITLLERLKNTWCEVLFCGALFILCLSMLASNAYNPFIYFRF